MMDGGRCVASFSEIAVPANKSKQPTVRSSNDVSHGPFFETFRPRGPFPKTVSLDASARVPHDVCA